MDPSVSVGTLPNGLRYYIRRNPTPAGRAELRLVVNAGSVLEDADQLGMAHFVEHMAFNGTTHYQKNELITYLQSIGMQFGADLNAHTNYDETTYELTVPTDSAALHAGLTILEDWAHGVQFDSANVVAERKVILEEWRLRTGAGTRIQLAHDSVRYRGTPYPSRLPIGTVESISNTNPAALKRFYHDWYRPNLMTVIVVGDFDQAAMVRAITRRFGALVNPKPARPRPDIKPALPTSPTVSLVQSPEVDGWSAAVMYHRPSTRAVPSSYGAYRDARVENVLLNILNQRLGQLAQQPNTPVLSAGVGEDRLQRGAMVYELVLTSKPMRLDTAIARAAAELARIGRDGVSPSELDAQQKILLRQGDDAVAQASAVTSAALAAQYVTNALRGNVSLSPTQIRTLLEQYVPMVTVADVKALAQAISADTAPFVVVSIPAVQSMPVDSATSRPSQRSLLAAVAMGRTMALPPYDAALASAPLVPYPPAAGTITTTRTIASIGVTEWTLSNGVHVLLKPMRTGDDKIYLSGTRAGGYALADSATYPSAVMAAQLLGAGGVGTLSNDAIRDRFPGVNAGVGTFIGDYADGVTGQSGARPDDRTLLFQLLYLKFTAPRVDSSVFARWRVEAEHPTQFDMQLLLLGQFLRNDSPFGRPVMGAVADSVDASRALSFYRSRFGDASDFTFVLAGAFTLDEIRPLVLQYLGGLPSTGAAATTRDLGVRPHLGPVQHFLLTQNVDPQAKTIMVFTTPDSATIADAATVNALATALQERLTFVLRQKLGGVYAVQVGGSVETTPYRRAVFQIVYTSDPNRVEELSRVVSAELDSMKTQGPTTTELHDFKEAVARNDQLAAAQPESWGQRLTAYVAKGWPIDQLSSELTIGSSVTMGQVRAMAERLFTEPNRIQVVAMPQRFFNQPSQPAAQPAATPATQPASETPKSSMP